MKKSIDNIWRRAALGVCTAAIIGGLTACSNDDNIIGTTDEPTPAAQGLRVTVEAQFDDGGGTQTRAVSFGSDGATSTSTFATGDKIYIYNNTKGALEPNELEVTDISADGKTAKFTGTLAGTYENGDVLTLYYNMYYFDSSDYSSCWFEYQNSQNGSADNASANDYAKATATVASVSGGTLTFTAPASLQKLQSVFRQRLSFTDKNGNAIAKPTITSLKIASKSDKLVMRYFLQDGDIKYNIAISNPTIDSSGDIYLALRFADGSSAADALTLTATDSEGNVYEGTKSAPSTGFQNGKYYHGAMTLAWTKQLVKPTITRNDGGTVPEPDMFNMYDIYESGGTPIVLTVSGTSSGYCIYLNGDNAKTVTLNGLNAVNNENSWAFISSVGSLNLVLSGDNAITCNGEQCILSNSTLKISGSGTLTVTANISGRYGLYGDVNYSDNDSSNSNASALAADGYTVTRSAMTSNVDGTYTWTYTVAPVTP